LFCVGHSIDRQRVTFVKRPAGCAARLFVEADGNVECNDDIGEVDAGARGRRIAAHTVTEPVLV